MTETEVKERPIIMGAESVRAILAGRKTETRRVVKPQPEYDYYFFDGPGEYWPSVVGAGGIERPASTSKYGIWDCDGYQGWPCPYGRPGDVLWVREAWYCDDDAAAQDLIGRQECPAYYRATEIHPDLYRWRSPIYMPRWACRLTLENQDVRVERLQDITPGGAYWVWVVQFKVIENEVKL